MYGLWAIAIDLWAMIKANALIPLNASTPFTLVGESDRSKTFFKLRFNENALSNFSKFVTPSLPSSRRVPRLSSKSIARKNVLEQIFMHRRGCCASKPSASL